MSHSTLFNTTITSYNIARLIPRSLLIVLTRVIFSIYLIFCICILYIIFPWICPSVNLFNYLYSITRTSSYLFLEYEDIVTRNWSVDGIDIDQLWYSLCSSIQPISFFVVWFSNCFSITASISDLLLNWLVCFVLCIEQSCSVRQCSKKFI